MIGLLEIKKIGKCCACEKPLRNSDFVNMIQIDKKAKWPFPIWGNVLTGVSDMACGYVCDSCIENGFDSGIELKFAVEFQDNEIIYHSIESL